MATLSMNTTSLYNLSTKTNARVDATALVLLNSTGTPEAYADARVDCKVNLRGETIVRYFIAPGNDICLTLSPDEATLTVKFENPSKKELWDAVLKNSSRLKRYLMILAIQRMMLSVKKDYQASY